MMASIEHAAPHRAPQREDIMNATQFKTAPNTDHTSFEAAMCAMPLPNPAEVVAAYRRTSELYAAHMKLMPSIW